MNEHKVDVYLHDCHVGTLAETADHRAAFAYSDAWLENGFAISPFSLPVEQKVYVPTSTTFQGLWGVFADSLPNAWGRLLVDRMLKSKGLDSSRVTPLERRVSTGISFFFMFLVGMSMPHFIGVNFAETHAGTHSVTGSQEMMSWGMILFHVVVVSLLSNLGKLCPMFFYRDRKLSERLALSIGMFTRGEVGAGIIFIALGYNLGGPALVISVLTLVLNLILTGIFVLWVKNLALRSVTTKGTTIRS